ncbi:MAG TPA: DUF1360 domain-containing protein [Mycobacteriales bacterium]|nr:DUF1360 domain-containing protein [Mycobacteriales bacterium]
MSTTAEAIEQGLGAVEAQYGRPLTELGGYSGVMAVYLTGLATAIWQLKAKRRLPSGFTAGDLALVALATHKLSRTISRDAVTSPARAPFTHFEGPSSPGEVKEKVAGGGVRKAVGELITCPFCMDQWIASGFIVGLAAAPRVTRFVASIFAVRAGADLLQFGYAAANKAAE